ncbi:2OG-Fe(II) oxygenase [soil metagenome]
MSSAESAPESIADDLKRTGISVRPGFFTAAEVAVTLHDFNSCHAAGKFKLAGIGHGGHHEMRATVRTDETHWLEREGANPTQAMLLDRFEELQTAFNRTLFLGLTDFEGHYASYAAGGFYQRHADAFDSSTVNESARLVSLVLYLNEDWKTDDGGMLRLYARGATEHTADSHRDIEPIAGTLVCFLSRETEHEVLKSQKVRRSLSGWFRRTS